MSRDVTPARRPAVRALSSVPADSGPPARPDDRLDSWKEIATYLSRDIRTLHRWEKHEGLPVHRHLHRKRATVWARRSELDLWREHPRLRAADGRRSSATTSAGRPGSTTERMMLAVLPFENLTGDPEQDYFSDGFTEEMISRLARFGELRLGVIARTSVMQYKGTRKSVDRIGRDLAVDYVLEGSVRRAADRVRITAQLIWVRDQSHVWAETYERDLRDILTVQSEVAIAIADRIRLRLPFELRARLAAKARPVHPRTYEAYLKGMFYRNRFTSEGFEKALSCFRQAVELDPLDPLPWAGLALCYAMASHSDLPARQPEEAFALVKDTAMKALALDDTLAEVHIALAELKLYYEWDWEGARAAFIRAFELNPNVAEAHRHYGWYLLLIGRPDDALVALRKAKQVEPIAPLYTAELAWLQLALGQFDEATEGALESLQLNPEFPIGWFVLGFVALQEGRFDEAISAHRQAVAASPGWRWGLGYTYARAGRIDEARKIISDAGGESEPADAWDAWTVACVAVGLGETDRAFKALEAAYHYRHSWMPWIGVIPMFDVLHSDARFSELVERLRLPEAGGHDHRT
jgi:TolB-like protein/Flp pilus assembly protein TadD